MNVVVIGGGLAGMVAAREIAARGENVVLLERSERLGGIAGSDAHEGRRIEHGYHVFPAWYPNVRRILNGLGIRLIDFDRYHYVLPKKFPAIVTMRVPTDLSAILHDLRHGLLPWYQTLLFFGFTVDMISQPLSAKRLLDRISQIGLMRSALLEETRRYLPIAPSDIRDCVLKPIEPKKFPRPLLVLARTAMLPALALSTVLARVAERFSGDRESPA